MFESFNKITLGNQISSLRKKRWDQYKSSKNDMNSRYRKFSFCKTQETLASALNMERRSVQSWESGTNSPSIENLVKLSNLLECSIDYFLGYTECTEINPIAHVAYISRISPDIIKRSMDDPLYSDCLNFFMSPENCETLFNNITLSAWKKYWIADKISNIKSPLKEYLFQVYNEYSAYTPIPEINSDTYRNYLQKKLPEESIIFKKEAQKNLFYLKECIDLKTYLTFFDKHKKYNHSLFLDYLVDYTFDPLSHNAFIEAQKVNLAKHFITLFDRFITDNIFDN